MLRIYTSEKSNSWEKYFNLIEFAYNQSSHCTIKMSPFEAVYGRNCNAPLSWSNLVHKKWYEDENIQEMEKMIKREKDNMKLA